MTPIDAAIDPAGLSPDVVGALVFTSANGVRAVHGIALDRSMRVYCVGEKTAACARNSGFTSVVASGGDVEALFAKITAQQREISGEVVHLAGVERAGNLVGRLQAAGMKARAISVYEMTSVDQLPIDIADALNTGSLTDVTFFSANSARRFIRLVDGAGALDLLRSLRVICISESVAACARVGLWQCVKVTKTPTVDAMIDTLTL